MPIVKKSVPLVNGHLNTVSAPEWFSGFQCPARLWGGIRDSLIGVRAF